jgi:hypothetical protein
MNANEQPTIVRLQALYARVKDVHGEAKLRSDEMQEADSSYHEACRRDSTLEERIALDEQRRPLFIQWCDACQRRDAARRAFFEQRDRFTAQYMSEAGVPGFLYTDDWRDRQAAFPELYES